MKILWFWEPDWFANFGIWNIFVIRKFTQMSHIWQKMHVKFNVYSIIKNKSFPDVYMFFIHDLNCV